MIFLYNILIQVVYLFLRIIALFNKKINLFVSGRKQTFYKLSSIQKTDKVIWLHAASLGEFEQGRPIIEQIKNQYPNYKIVLTFFSPSGYEVRKNYNLADVVCYLPFDTKKNIRKFINKIHPELAIIIKYEFWPNLLNELKKTSTKTILVSGIFRENQPFFRFYGKWMQQFLFTFDHFFVQNKKSEELLNTVGFNNITVSRDTRFDRVYQILQQDNSLDFIEKFKNDKYTVVVGSSWDKDEELLVNYINNTATENEKFIIAPHNIHQKNIEELQRSIVKKTVLYSKFINSVESEINLFEYQVFIVDTVGILTKIYAYANVAYVGGGLQTGLHNILEPATFGIPIVFGGNKYKKFKEATDLVSLNGCKKITNQQEFSAIFAELFLNKNLRTEMGSINKNYVKNNIGATNLILNYIKNTL